MKIKLKKQIIKKTLKKVIPSLKQLGALCKVYNVEH